MLIFFSLFATTGRLIPRHPHHGLRQRASRLTVPTQRFNHYLLNPEVGTGSPIGNLLTDEITEATKARRRRTRMYILVTLVDRLINRSTD